MTIKSKLSGGKTTKVKRYSALRSWSFTNRRKTHRSALDISQKNLSPPYNTRNAYGMGFVKDDAAMRLALDPAGHGRGKVTTSQNTFTKVVTVKRGRTYRAAITWMRQNTASKSWSSGSVSMLFVVPLPTPMRGNCWSETIVLALQLSAAAESSTWTGKE